MTADFDALVEKAMLGMYPAAYAWRKSHKDGARRQATAALEAISLPALLERVEAAESESDRFAIEAARTQAAIEQRGHDVAAEWVLSYRNLAADRDALAAKVADIASGVRAWCAINEIAEPPLDWVGLGEFLDRVENA